MTELEAKIYQIVSEAAEKNLPCPTKRDLCKGVKLGFEPVSRAWRALVLSGMIKIEREGIGYGAIVTICATGKTTSDIRFRRLGYLAAQAERERFAASDAMADRVAADQAALRARQAYWLGEHQRKYGRTHGTRLLSDMPA